MDDEEDDLYGNEQVQNGDENVHSERATATNGEDLEMKQDDAEEDMDEEEEDDDDSGSVTEPKVDSYERVLSIA